MTTYAVVPVLIGPLQIILTILPGLILAALSALISLLHPRAVLNGLKILWRQKVQVVVVVALNLTVVAYLATPPVAYERATIETTAGITLEGAYLGRTSNGVYLGTCEPWSEGARVSKLARVRIVAPAEIKRLTLGGSRYVFDVGTRPTLFELTRWFLTGQNMENGTKTALLDLRLRRKTCVWDTIP